MLDRDVLGNLIATDQFIEIGNSYDFDLWLKLEGLNPAGSIKLKTAISLVDEGEKSGKIHPNSTIIESSSGNLGIALAMVCANRGYSFTCVLDLNSTNESITTIKALGGKVVIIEKKDSTGGYLQSRIDYILDMLKCNDQLVWLNQYANPANSRAHFNTTAAEIFSKFPDCDYLFVGAGTTGTLMGCAEFKLATKSTTKIIAVDVDGSVTFDAKPQSRKIPGLGTSRKPEICRAELVDDVLWVSETDTVRNCRQFAKKFGMLLGGSSGSVLAGVDAYQSRIPSGSKVVAISPDMGSKYLSSVYCDNWVLEHYPLAISHREADETNDLTKCADRGLV